MSTTIQDFLQEDELIKAMQAQLDARKAAHAAQAPAIIAIGNDPGNTVDVNAIAAQLGAGISIGEIEAAPLPTSSQEIAGSVNEFNLELARREAQIRKAVAISVGLVTAAATAGTGGGAAAIVTALGAAAGTLMGDQ